MELPGLRYAPRQGYKRRRQHPERSTEAGGAEGGVTQGFKIPQELRKFRPAARRLKMRAERRDTGARGSVRRRQYQALFPMKQEAREFIRE